MINIMEQDDKRYHILLCAFLESRAYGISGEGLIPGCVEHKHRKKRDGCVEGSAYKYWGFRGYNTEHIGPR